MLEQPFATPFHKELLAAGFEDVARPKKHNTRTRFNMCNKEGTLFDFYVNADGIIPDYSTLTPSGDEDTCYAKYDISNNRDKNRFIDYYSDFK